jgi:YesN/AraC family two-component response regulator
VTRIRILVADDQPLVRTGIRRVIDSDEALAVIGEASDGHEAVALTKALRPDVVLMDIRMPILDGIEATSRLTESEAMLES